MASELSPGTELGSNTAFDPYAAPTQDVLDPAVVDRLLAELSLGSVDAAEFVVQAIHASNLQEKAGNGDKFSFLRGVLWARLVETRTADGDELRQLIDGDEFVIHHQPTLFDFGTAA